MARIGPWRREFSAPLFLLHNEFNRFFDEYASRFSPSQGGGPTDVEPGTWSPTVDQTETPDAYVVVVEVPGVDPSSIDLSVTGNVLTIRGVKPPEGETEPTGPVQERQFGPFHRQVALSGEVNFDAAQADARLGVLRITLPKREVAKPRTIPVRSR